MYVYMYTMKFSTAQSIVIITDHVVGGVHRVLTSVAGELVKER